MQETEAAVSLVGGGAMPASGWGLLASMFVAFVAHDVCSYPGVPACIGCRVRLL